MSLYSLAIAEGQHYRLGYYPDHGWEWTGLGLFDNYCCEHPYPSEDDARNAAVKALLKLLTA